MLRAVKNKSWKPHLSKQQLYGYLPPIIQTIQVRHVGHYWRSKDELISDVLLWTLTYGRTICIVSLESKFCFILLRSEYSSNLINFLLRCGARPQEWSIQCNSNSLMKIYKSYLLTITPPETPRSECTCNSISFLLRCGPRPYEWDTW